MSDWILKTASATKGFWEPHTSSVDFCEPNYLVSDMIAEFHNVWSSLVICVFGVIGIMYCNLTSEWRNFFMFSSLIVVGLGSVALHTTLHAFGQSTDEVPMLWANIVFLFHFLTIRNSVGVSTKALEIGAVALAIAQAYVYYETRHLYWVFLVSYIVPLTTVVLWTIKLIFFSGCTTEHRAVRLWLWGRSVLSYIFIASLLWIYEMHHCAELLRYFEAAGGLTFHILWHIGAGLGAYFQMLLLIAIRVQHLGGDVEIKRLCGLFPIITLKTPLKLNKSQ